MTSPAFNAFATTLALALPATPPRRNCASRTGGNGSSIPGTPRSTRITVTASPVTPSTLDSSPWNGSTPPTSLRILRFVHNLATPSPRARATGSPLARGCHHSPRGPVNVLKSRSSALARLSPTMAQKPKPKPGPPRANVRNHDEDKMDVDSPRLGDAGVRRKLFSTAAPVPVRPGPRKSMPATLNNDDDWLPLASARRGVSMLPTRSEESLLLDPTQRGVKRKRA